jgi:hypothetical protein
MSTDKNIPLELMNELYRSYDFLNQHYCEGKLPRPIIIVSSNFNKKAHGWFSPSRWRLGADKTVSEITLCGESFQRGYEDVLGTLIHEMAHLKNYVDNDNKVVDCSDQQRHNNIFKKTAEFFGLEVTSSKRFGPAHTTLGDTAHKALNALKPNKKLYELYAEMKTKDEKKKKESKLKPVMIDKETKTMIQGAAKALGMTEKALVTGAVQMFISLDERIASFVSALNQTLPVKSQITVDYVKNFLTEPAVKVESK